MARKKEHITLSGGRAERFREIREDFENDLGYEPSKPEVIGRLFELYSAD
jgi:hypothetical protein